MQRVWVTRTRTLLPLVPCSSSKRSVPFQQSPPRSESSVVSLLVPHQEQDQSPPAPPPIMHQRGEQLTPLESLTVCI